MIQDIIVLNASRHVTLQFSFVLLMYSEIQQLELCKKSCVDKDYLVIVLFITISIIRYVLNTNRVQHLFLSLKENLGKLNRPNMYIRQ